MLRVASRAARLVGLPLASRRSCAAPTRRAFSVPAITAEGGAGAKSATNEAATEAPAAESAPPSTLWAKAVAFTAGVAAAGAYFLVTLGSDAWGLGGGSAGGGSGNSEGDEALYAEVSASAREIRALREKVLTLEHVVSTLVRDVGAKA